MTLETFEEDFQWFMHGGYPRVFEENWERYYAQLERHEKEVCSHGKTKLTCDKCYFAS